MQNGHSEGGYEGITRRGARLRLWLTLDPIYEKHDEHWSNYFDHRGFQALPYKELK